MILYNDSNGETKQRGARLSFAHHLTLDRYEDEFLSFGLSYNFNQFRIDIENFDGIIISMGDIPISISVRPGSRVRIISSRMKRPWSIGLSEAMKILTVWTRALQMTAPQQTIILI